MTTVEFQAEVKNGAIIVPEEYKQALSDGSSVQVIVTQQPKKRIVENGIFAELMHHPAIAPGVRSMTREEMHDRNA
jgi:hypothetical protein